MDSHSPLPRAAYGAVASGLVTKPAVLLFVVVVLLVVVAASELATVAAPMVVVVLVVRGLGAPAGAAGIAEPIRRCVRSGTRTTGRRRRSSRCASGTCTTRATSYLCEAHGQGTEFTQSNVLPDVARSPSAPPRPPSPVSLSCVSPLRPLPPNSKTPLPASTVAGSSSAAGNCQLGLTVLGTPP